jgi:hypothetical protein
MFIALEQHLLFHEREKIINKIDEIKKNHKENKCMLSFFISLAFFLY